MESQAIKALGALAEQTRLRIIRYLVRCGPEGAAAGAIGEQVGASSSRLSFHLSVLENAGIVTSKRVSRRIFYRVDFDRLGSVFSYLLKDCCNNDPTINACCTRGGKGC